MLAHLDLLIAGLLLAAAVLIGNRWKAPPSLWLVLIAGAAFAVLPVMSYWWTARTHPNAVGGLIPWNDAAGFFGCAHQIIAGAPHSSGCAMRPYYAIALAGLLDLVQGTAQWALLLQAAVVGAVIAFAAREIWRSHGPIAGFSAFAALFVFASQFTMTMLSENAGLVLGMLAFALLWRRTESISPAIFLVVMMLLTVGLNARAGAFASVPLLLLWSLLWTEGTPRRRVLRTLAGVVGIGLAGGLNAFLVDRLGGSAIGTHSNFAYVLYGVSVGGARYLQVLIDHPELRDLSGDAFTREVYRLALDNILSQPHMLVIGYFRGLAHWLYGLFRFVEWWPLRGALIILWGVGLLASLWPVRKPRARQVLVRILVLGVAVSSPFLTWYGGNRIFAVTYPVDALLVSIGLITAMGLAGRGVEVTTERPPGAGVAAAGALLVAVLPAIILPFLLAFPPLKALATTVECRPGETGLVADLGHDSPVLSIVGRQETSVWPLRLDAADFSSHIDIWTADRDHLMALTANTSLVMAFDRRSGKPAPSQLLLWRGDAPEFGISRICLRPSGSQRWIAEATRLELVR